MKSPLGKLKGFKMHGKGGDARDVPDFSKAPTLIDELAQAAQDMQDMRDCYDSLLAAAAATANSAYEFSESLREMGACLMEKTALYDGESCSVMLKLAKVQFELQILVDSYRSHILSTITNPSDSLLNELRNVEDMKRQCDEKRSVYEYMVAQQKEKRRSKSAKGDQCSFQQLQAAHDEYSEDATLCVFRLKSLKQGQSRSLLTQAARHHAAQLTFFRKGLRSLEAVEPHVRYIAELQHIDYRFRGLEDDGREYGHDNDNGDDINEDRELSFDYRISKQGHGVSASRNSMEVDEDDISFPQTSATASSELNASSRERRASSYSAPIFMERKSEGFEKLKQMHQPSSKKSYTYVLPTPNDAKGPASSRTSNSGSNTRPAENCGRSSNLWHSSPLEQKKHGKEYGDDQILESTGWKVYPAQRERTNNTSSTQLPQPLVEGSTVSHPDVYDSSDSRKVKRLSYSGPINSKPSTISASGSISRAPVSHTLSPPKVSPSSSPPLVSSPRISELHELPRPPASLSSRPPKALPLVGHSAPLVRGSEDAGNNKVPSSGSNFASPLPIPPLVVPRSFSIPASGQRTMAVHVSRLMESPRLRSSTGEVDSPPLTPISLASIKQASALTSRPNQ